MVNAEFRLFRRDDRGLANAPLSNANASLTGEDLAGASYPLVAQNTQLNSVSG
ncbi:MAG: hypothetical protein RMY29_021750 [Nostoc sp. CreGUA01]|nr:hypothetical protein [Nostoc sp. CreGUA01]